MMKKSYFMTGNLIEKNGTQKINVSSVVSFPWYEFDAPIKAHRKLTGLIESRYDLHKWEFAINKMERIK